MKEYIYNVFLKNIEGEITKQITTIFHAKNDVEADIIVKRQYPTAKGFMHEKINVSD